MAFIASLLTWINRLDHYDQSLFRLGSKILRDGGLMYRDIWDLKQPGIYWFYQYSEQWLGNAAGVSGVHVMSSIWLASAATVLAAIIYMIRPSSRAWMSVPLLVTLTLSLRIDVWSVAQVETLLPLPIAGVIICLLLGSGPETRHHTSLYFVAGLMAGVVGVFKLILAPVPVIMIMFAAIYTKSQPTFWHWLKLNSVAAIGFIVVYALSSLPFVLAGELDLFIWSQFIYPTSAVALHSAKPIADLFKALLHLGSSTILFVPAAVLGIVNLAGPKDSKARMLLSLLTIWIVIGFIFIAAQTLSWYGYHMLLLLPPFAMLAAAAFIEPNESHATHRRWRRLAFGLVVLAFVVNIGRFATFNDEHRYGNIDASTYLSGVKPLKQALHDTPCQRALIFGSPVLFHITRLSPSSEITGQLASMLLSEQWADLQAQTQARPPMFIYYERDQLFYREQKTLGLHHWISANYQEIAVDSKEGVWLKHRPSTQHPATIEQCSTR